LGTQRLLFDPTKVPSYWRSKSSLACISHAHADHTGSFGTSIRKVATQPTIDIYHSLGGKLKRVIPFQLDEKIPVAEGTLHIENAGHMLGAVQFVFEKDSTRIVYTGDFNLTSSLTAEGAKPIPCDILLMEATYGKPGAEFPPRETVYAEIAEWVSHTIKKGIMPVFEVYGTGKAQEIIRVINTYLTTPVVVDSTVAKVSEIYCKNSIQLKFFSMNSQTGRELLLRGDCVFISSKRSIQTSFMSGKKILRARATGWAQLFPLKNTDKAFVLSAHADFQQLVRYVREANPRAVYITCGDTVTFGAVLQKLGVRQIIPYQKRQLKLSDFT
jgi:Cft2 family RNA processing exonuclease